MHVFTSVTRLLSLLLIACCLVSYAGAERKLKVQKPPALDRLVMVYLDADNDLEPYLMLDLIEMQKAGYSKNVRVIILADRTPFYKDEARLPNEQVVNLKNWNTGKVLEIGPKGFIEVADWGEVDMGDSKTLSRFISFSLKRHKAKQNMLILSDHGSGWQGGWADEGKYKPATETTEAVYDITDLTLFEIRDGLKNGLGGKKLDLLGFDACLMANLESALAFQPYARFMVASEELEPGFGWAYTPVMKHMYANPKGSMEALGKVIVDSFMNFYLKDPDERMRAEGQASQLAVLDLARAPKLGASMQRLGRLLRGNLESEPSLWTQLAEGQAKAQQFGAMGNDDDVALFDIESVCQVLSELKNVPLSMATEIANVRKDLKSFVKYTVKGDLITTACGVTIFWPFRDVYLNQPGMPHYSEALPAPRNDQWFGFVNLFVRALKTDTAPPVLGEVQRVPEGISATLEGPDALRVLNILARKDGDDYLVLGSMPVPVPTNGDPVRAPFTGSWLVVTDGSGAAYAPVINAEFGETSAVVYMMASVKTPGSQEWREAVLGFKSGYGAKDVGKLAFAIEVGSKASRYIEMRKGTEVRLMYPKVTPAGDMSFAVGQDVTLKIGAKGLTLGSAELANGSYIIGFLAEDFSGNMAMKVIEVRKGG